MPTIPTPQQRANKLERLRVMEALREIWVTAYEEKEAVFEFKPDQEREAKIFHQALADYRKKINRKSLEFYDIFLKIDAVQLCKPSPTTVKLVRKAKSLSHRSEIVLNVLNDNQSLFKGVSRATPFKDTLDNILDTIK